MKKILKLFAWVGAGLVVLLGLASVALHVLLPPEKAKALVLKQLTTHLKREVTVGTANVGVLSGLSLSELKISESPNFSKGTFVSSDHFSIRLSLWPLLFKKIEVNQITLDHPVIQIVRYADGKTFNFSDLMTPASPPPVKKVSEAFFAIPEAYAAPAPSATSPNQAEPSFSLLISNAVIQKGVVHFVDHSAAKQSLDINALDLKLKNVSMTSPFAVQTSLQVKAQNVIADLQLAGEADLATDSFKIKTCSLSSAGSTLELSGTANHLKSAQPSVDLTLNVKEFKLATVAPFIALPPALRLDGPILANARVKGDQKKMDIAAQVDLEKVQVIYGKQFTKPAKVPMWASVRGDLAGLQDLNLVDLKMILGSLQIVSHGKILGVTSADPQISLHVESNAFPVNELLDRAAVKLPKDVTVAGKAQLAADVSGTQTSSHIALKFEGKALDIASGETFRKPAEVPLRVSMVGEWIQHGGAKTLTFQNVTAILGSNELTGTGSVGVSAVPPKLQLGFKGKAISLDDIARLSPLMTPYHLSGIAGLDAKVSGTSAAPLIIGSLSLQNTSVRFEQSELTNIVTGLTFTQQDVNIPRLTGKLNGSEITVKLVGRQLTTHPDVNVDANIKEVDLEKLLPTQPAQSSGLRTQKKHP